MEDLEKQLASLSPAKRALLERKRQQAVGSAAGPAIRPRQDQDAPLSFAQLRLWLIHQLDPQSSLYNVPRAVRMKGKLDLSALQRAMNEIVRRHEVLRSTYPADGWGQPAQRIRLTLDIPLPVTDLGRMRDDQRLPEVQRLALEEVRRPFDLAQGPPLRARVLRLSDEDHVLVLAMHHIVSDGWTGGILFQELGALYQAFSADQPSPLPELTIQYSDYAVWQGEWMQGPRLDGELAYWRKQLADAPPLVELPTDRPRPEAGSYRGAKSSLLLPKSLSDNLKTFSQSEGLTLFTAMLAALNILLFRWSGREDLVLGTVSANRNRTEIENLIGCFMNFLPLRNRAAGNKSALEFLGEVNQTVLGAFAHQECPFEKLIETLNPQRALNVNPLYNVALLMQNFPEMAFRCDSVEARFLPLDTQVAFLDLRFVAAETTRGIELECEYNVDLFDAGTIEHLLHNYQTVLERLAAVPQTKLAEFELSDALATQAASARRREQKLTIAVTATFTAEPLEESLTYWMDQLGIRARIEFAPYNQVFQQLLDPSSLLAQNQDGFNLVLVRMEDWQRFNSQASSTGTVRERIQRNVEELIAAAKNAALRSAVPHVLCACPPSKAALAEGKLFEEMEALLVKQLAKTASVHVITSTKLLELYRVASYEDAYADKLGHIPYVPALFTALGTMIARRVYSIRSAPHKVIVLDCDHTLWKGVCGEDGALGVEVDAAHRALQEFMIAQHDAGMILCLCSKNTEEDVKAVFEQNTGMVLRREHVVASRINWQPKSQNLKELAQELQLGLDSFIFLDDNPLECAEVQANCPEVLTLQLPKNPEQIPVFLRHVWAFDHWKVTKEDAQRTSLYRENVERQQLRKGTASLEDFLAGLELEIDIRPMAAEDLGRVSQLTERTNQFNLTTIRRTEAEIEKLLQSGSECLLVDLRDRFGVYGLVGVMIFSAEQNAVTVDTLLLSCRALGRKVEHHMLAKLGVVAQERGLADVNLPYIATRKNQPALDFLQAVGVQFEEKNRNGRAVYRFPAAYAASAVELKMAETDAPVDQSSPRSSVQQSGQSAAVLARIASDLNDVDAISQAIGSQKQLRSRSQQAFVAPRTAKEEILAGIWAHLLHLQKVGIHDNFFALGGHSLLATQVVARIRQTLGIELPLRAMFEAPSIAQLAERVEAVRRTEPQPEFPPLVRTSREKCLPLSFAQQRMWFLDQMEPGNPLYNIPQMIRMRGELNLEALQESINEIVRRHEVLRTTFATENNQPVQVISPELRLPLSITDLSTLDESECEREAQRLAKQEAVRPFDLSKGPLLSAHILRLTSDEHVLLLNMHHIVSDRWSLGLLAEELATLYSALAQGKPCPLPELPVQYADFAVWQRQWLHGETLEHQISYWKKQLSGAPAVLELPTDRLRPAVQTYRGSTQTRLVPKKLVEKLTALSQTEGVTLFMTLLAAFQTLLSRYSGQEDVVVGSPIANRNHAEIENLIGFFVNTLALRADLSGNPSFRELLSRVKTVALDAYAYQDVPFEKLVEELQPERSLSHNPVFQVMFALQNAPMQALELSGLQVERSPVYTDTSIFDMSWFAIEVPDGLLVRAEYNTDLFDDATITRALGHFHNLVEGIAARPGQRLSELPLLGEEERHQILVEFNATEKDFPEDLCIHHFLEQQAAKSPDAVALISDQQRISYRDLNARANRIAHHLLKRGAGPDVLVGIFSERSVDMVCGILGILKAGGAYVPLDPAYPKERLRYILEDAKAPIVLTQRSLISELPKCTAQFICLDFDWKEIARESSENPATSVKPQNLAYVLFTSGSTGRPKGVALEHRSAAMFIHWAKSVYTPKQLAGVLLSTSICFDLSVFEMFVPLSVGGKVIIAPNTLYLPTLPAKDEVTLINTVPSAMAELVRMRGVPESVKTVNLAGEALSEALVEEIYASTKVEEVYNLYGPTEDTTYSTFTLVPRGSAVTIGRPISNTQAYVVDAHRNPVPISVPGELYLAGEGLARGYFGRDDLTAERFLSDPFSDTQGARMYRTGDLCRWLPDGNLQYLGRIDHQVKLRGFRIELGEIEAALARHPGVRQNVVTAREDEPGLKRLVAYVVSRTDTAPGAEELRNHLKQTLPEFMIPSAFVILETFPLTPNGKVNRRALPVPEYSRAEAIAYVAPRTPVEETVTAIWAELLHLPQVGAEDDFFALGGHSLIATQVISRLRQTFRVELPLRTIFEAPTAAGLAGRIEGARREFAVPPIQRVPRDHAIPASFAQQRLWFLDQLESNNPLYNIPWTMRVSGALNVDALEQTLNTILKRHDSLRTIFATVDDQPVQVIQPSLRLPLRINDLSGLPEAQHQIEARRLIAEEAHSPFDLARGPLLRATLLRLGAEEHILLINIHHIISDRWSMGVLSQELATLYEALAEGKPSPLPELPVQYPDYAVWQRQWLTGDVLEKQLAYWKEQLKNAPPVLELPTDRPRLATESFRGEIATIRLSKDTSEKLSSLSRSEGATLFMTLLAGFQALLARYTGQEDIVIGTAIANRSRAELENLIGFFVNTLPLRTDLSGDPTFRGLISRAREVALGAYAHQEMPFEKLVEELRPERSLSHNPLVQVFFVLQNAPMEALQLKNLRLKPIESGTKTAKGDMYLSMIETPEGLRGRVEYNTDLFEAATVERMLGHYRQMLEAAVANPGLRLSQLPLLSEEERKQLVVEWNATQAEYPHDVCLHELIAQQAKRTPQRTAVVFGQQQLSYGELHSRSNQLAHYLRRCGVRSEVRVGLFVERSPEMVVALLGILKAGGAYVPLDPAYPKERISFIVEDAQAPVVVTQRGLREALPGRTGQTICLDADWDLIARESAEDLETGTTPDHLAYVLYTSGSTGKPKGVQIEHGNVVNFLASMQRNPGLTGQDTLLAVTTLSFDIAGLELYLPLVAGARVVLASREEASDGRRLLDLLSRSQATVMQATPATWRMLLEAGWPGSEQLKVLCGGEALPAELAAQLLPRCGQLWNLYGPTETTIWSSVYRVEAALAGTTPIGRPIANTTFYILDAQGQPVPVGVAGELYIGGAGVARGYLNRPEMTAEKFLADRFRPGERMYRTGDVAKYLPDGTVQFLGRADFQVKVRGYRIELGEIESALSQHPGVQQCVAVAREDVAGDKRLVGYVVVAPGETINASELRAWVKERLPEYMVPVAFVQMPRLPLTPNGKVDRKHLPAPDYTRPELAGEYQGARTPTEEVLAGIWAEVLKLDQVGIHDDFFELGAHSLLATRVMSRIRQAFQVELPLRALFEAPTVARLAERVETLEREQQGLLAPPLKAVGRDQPAPLSFAQQRLWFLDQLEPDNPLYNVAHIVRLRGVLDVAALEKSLNEIVRRHETLRTSFQTVDDQPVQVIAPSLTIPLAVAEVTSLPEAGREAEARRRAIEEVQRPFNLSTGPLLRALAIKIGTDDHALILNTHHIISDRWSLGVLSQELAALYEAYVQNQPSPLPELALQYADYAVWQQEFLSGEVLQKQLSYWRQQLEGAPPVLDLPTDHPRKAVENFWGSTHQRALPEDLVKDLRSLSRRASATFFITLLAAFQTLLAHCSGQEDVVVGTDLANRTQLETEKLIGFFVNLLPIRIRLSQDISFRKVLQQVREVSLGAFAHQDVPFEKLVEELRPERKLSHNPLVQVLFVMQNTPQFVREFGGLKVGPLGVSSTSRFDLVLFINDPDGCPFATWMYNPNLFDVVTITRMAAQYETVLRNIVADPEVKLSSLAEVMTETEKQQRAAQQKIFQETSLHKLRTIKRKTMTEA